MNGSEMASALERVFIDSGYFDLSVQTPGSPAYVRRLRDQAVSDRLARFGSGPMVKEDVRGAVRYANYMVEALGYQIPEDGEVKP